MSTILFVIEAIFFCLFRVNLLALLTLPWLILSHEFVFFGFTLVYIHPHTTPKTVLRQNFSRLLSWKTTFTYTRIYSRVSFLPKTKIRNDHAAVSNVVGSCLLELQTVPIIRTSFAYTCSNGRTGSRSRVWCIRMILMVPKDLDSSPENITWNAWSGNLSSA